MSIPFHGSGSMVDLQEGPLHFRGLGFHPNQPQLHPSQSDLKPAQRKNRTLPQTCGSQLAHASANIHSADGTITYLYCRCRPSTTAMMQFNQLPLLASRYQQM